MFGRTRRMPAGPALLALSSGAPLLSGPTYTTRDGLGRGADAGVDRADRQAEGRHHRAHPRARGGVRAGDRRRAPGLASVPARLGTVRIALVCPYAWEAAGGVQVHVKNLAARLLERGHEAIVLDAHDRGSLGTMGAVGGSSGPGLLPGDGRPDRATVLSQGPVVAGLLPSGRRPRPRAAHAERVDVRDARRERARRRDGPRLPRPVGRDGAGRSDPPPDLAAGDGRRRRLGRRGVVPPTGPSGRGARDRSQRGGRRRLRRGGAARRPASPDGGSSGSIGWTPRRASRSPSPRSRRCWSEVPDAILVVVGEGKDREALGLLTESERARVDMRGAVPNEEVPSYLAACEVFVSPAVGQESFGIALIEAMAAGLPVVAADIPGYREVVSDGVEGLLVPPAGPGGARGRPGPSADRAGAGVTARRGRPRARTHLRLAARRRAAGGAVPPRHRERWLR